MVLAVVLLFDFGLPEDLNSCSEEEIMPMFGYTLESGHWLHWRWYEFFLLYCVHASNIVLVRRPHYDGCVACRCCTVLSMHGHCEDMIGCVTELLRNWFKWQLLHFCLVLRCCYYARGIASWKSMESQIVLLLGDSLKHWLLFQIIGLLCRTSDKFLALLWEFDECENGVIIGVSAL